MDIPLYYILAATSPLDRASVGSYTERPSPGLAKEDGCEERQMGRDRVSCILTRAQTIEGQSKKIKRSNAKNNYPPCFFNGDADNLVCLMI